MEKSENTMNTFNNNERPKDGQINEASETNTQNLKLQNTSNNKTNRFKKTKGRVKIKMEFIENKIRRYTTFSKRKTGIMKKAYELSTLTGTQVMLLVASETGHVYTYATEKLQPMITSEAGKSLIQSCLSQYNDDENNMVNSDNKICIENFTNEADFGDDDDEDDEYYENDNDDIVNDSQEENMQTVKNLIRTSEDLINESKSDKVKRKPPANKSSQKSNKKQKINETTQFSIPPAINQILTSHQQYQKMQQQTMTVSAGQIIDNQTLARTIQFGTNSIK